MRKLSAGLFLTAALMLVMSSSAFASIRSEAEIQTKASALERMSNYDLLNLINKSELVGDRRSNFSMSASQYQNEARMASENMRKVITQIASIKNLNEEYMSSNDKRMQINKLYQDADAILYDMNNKAMNHLYSVMNYMPSMTYQKYARKFSSYYNSQNLTEVRLEVR